MINVIPIPAFEDNYIWVIRNGRCAAAVDPGDAAPLLDYLGREGLRLVAVLNTHHHGDHVAGNADLLARFEVPVYGPKREHIATVSEPLEEGDRVRLPELSLELAVLDIPGHTAGHIAYYGANALFCGDTLFGCGCGRLFEGSPAQMHASLQKLARLPDDTLVYCAHEYTLANIRFAKSVEPCNGDLAQREETDRRARSENRPTLPSTIGLERRTNPFLRCDQPEIIRAASAHAGMDLPDTVAVFRAVREWKDRA